MQLFVGLGNPGNKYENHRHNVGFQLMDALCADHAANFTINKKFNAEIAEISVTVPSQSGALPVREKILLVKPLTYMNRSGQAVQAVSQFYKISPEAITVFHDELDLPLGKIKIKQGGGHGGHNGLRDIDAHLGKNYRRVRIGIDHPGHKDLVSNYVLHDFSKKEAEIIAHRLEDFVRYQVYLATQSDAELLRKISEFK